MGSEAYTPAEIMTAVAARELRDGEVVFVGIGLLVLIGWWLLTRQGRSTAAARA